ncbi:hypothetical protein FHU41_001157 [Psychromicrobium silvestre]|uniref:Lipoprotein n=1 Tax=Psychromicrobium silvestre TaxID=1645614 RepID=A0A7Y9LST3_9MICC|nr:hypothetical protein [Psychromicrobium silvestre]NYE94936.1 hypothetical protein [Psychromicrobium silvestre]
MRTTSARAFAATLAGISALLLLAGLTACTITVPSPQDTSTLSPSPSPTYSAPTVLPGHNADAVAAKELSWAAGNTLSVGVPVAWTDQLTEPDTSGDKTVPSKWKSVKLNQAGWTEYQHANGCVLSLWQTVNQQSLMVANDDKASTVALFKYLIPSILPETLKATTMRWAKELDKPSPKIQLLTLRTPAKNKNPARIYSARMFNRAGTGIVFSLSCSSDALLNSTFNSIQPKLAVSPPQQ